MPEARNDPGRDETEEGRSDRNLTDLLQELRVAGLGVQVLFGFLLSLPRRHRVGDLHSYGAHYPRKPVRAIPSTKNR